MHKQHISFALPIHTSARAHATTTTTKCLELVKRIQTQNFARKIVINQFCFYGECTERPIEPMPVSLPGRVTGLIGWAERAHCEWNVNWIIYECDIVVIIIVISFGDGDRKKLTSKCKEIGKWMQAQLYYQYLYKLSAQIRHIDLDWSVDTDMMRSCQTGAMSVSLCRQRRTTKRRKRWLRRRSVTRL